MSRIPAGLKHGTRAAPQVVRSSDDLLAVMVLGASLELLGHRAVGLLEQLAEHSTFPVPMFVFCIAFIGQSIRPCAWKGDFHIGNTHLGAVEIR